MKRGLFIGLCVGLCVAVSSALVAATTYLSGFSAVVTIADTDNTFWCQTSGGCASTNPLKRVTAAQIKAYVLPSTAVTPGSYTNSNITVQADGRVTAASNGSTGSPTGSGVDGGTSSQTVTGSTVLNNATRLAKLGSGWATGTITLPAISAVSTDSSICIDDGGAFVSGSATLTVAPNAVDALSGGTIGASSPVYTTGGLSLCWRVTATHNWALESGSSLKASDASTNQFANGVDSNGLKYTQPTVSNVSGAAPLASPALIGTPTTPTASVGTNTTQIASTAFVLANAGAGGASQATSRQRFTSGSGATYTTPANANKLIITQCGGGGGSGGLGAGAGTGGTGGTTTFNSVTAIGGSGGGGTTTTTGGTGGVGGQGGAGSLGTGGFRITGGDGTAGDNVVGAIAQSPGGTGGTTYLGPAQITTASNNGAGANGDTSSSALTGGSGGGGGGECLQQLITTPSATYTYTVGGGGAAGAGTTIGVAGNPGVIIVDEFYGVISSVLTNHAPLIGTGSGINATAAMTNGQFLVGASGADPAPQVMSQDCTMTSGGVITCLKTNNVSFGALATTIPGTGVATAASINLSANGGLTKTVFSGAKALATGAISSAACTSAQTDTATGTLTTDVVLASFNGDPTAVTGYVPLTSGMLTIIAYPTADTVNFKVCNNTSGSITPGAITLNWRVVR